MESEKLWIDQGSFKIEGDDEFDRERIWNENVDETILHDIVDYTWLYK